MRTRIGRGGAVGRIGVVEGEVGEVVWGAVGVEVEGVVGGLAVPAAGGGWGRWTM
jgi:hypothetical protein